MTHPSPRPRSQEEIVPADAEATGEKGFSFSSLPPHLQRASYIVRELLLWSFPLDCIVLTFPPATGPLLLPLLALAGGTLGAYHEGILISLRRVTGSHPGLRRTLLVFGALALAVLLLAELFLRARHGSTGSLLVGLLVIGGSVVQFLRFRPHETAHSNGASLLIFLTFFILPPVSCRLFSLMGAASREGHLSYLVALAISAALFSLSRPREN